jgi:hypothetical protein
MRGSCGLYPGIGRYFESKQELADAGCMTRQRLDDCLHGRKAFTDQEKVAISNYIFMKTRYERVSPANYLDEFFRVKGA